MAINYNKYIESTGTHWIGNSGHDERGRYNGGAAGDQTGEEARLRAWYYRPWTVVLRHPDPAVALEIAKLEIEMCLNDNVGYDQYQRTTYWKELVKANYVPSAIKVKCEQDCTAGTTANVKAVGYRRGVKALQEIGTDTYSGNMKARFVKAGFRALTASKYLTGPKYLLPGDVLLYEGHHAAVNITIGQKARSVWTAQGVESEPALGDRVLKNGMTGADVKELQARLVKLGYDLGPYGTDGDFGDMTEMAVRLFQKDARIGVDGEFGAESLAALEAMEDMAASRIPGNDWVEALPGLACYVRAAPGGNILGALSGAKRLPYMGATIGDGAWLCVEWEGGNACVSAKYARVV